MFYDLETDTNSSSNELKSHMDKFILLIIIMLQQSYKGFGSGQKHVLNICTKSYSNGLGPPYDFLTH